MYLQVRKVEDGKGVKVLKEQKDVAVKIKNKQTEKIISLDNKNKWSCNDENLPCE